MIPSPTDTEALANRINLHTRDAHNKVDTRLSIKMAFVMRHDFIYIDILKNFYLIFNTIEQNIDHILTYESNDDRLLKSRQILKQFYIDEFRRSDNISKDLAFFGVDSKQLLQEKIEENLPPKLSEFLEYIEYNVKKDPLTVLAYCHVLYLALFAGGRIFRSSFMRNIGFLGNYKSDLSQHELIMRATNFFQFDESAQQEIKLKLKYKENFELSTRNTLTEPEKLIIINTSRDIFRYVYNIFEEISKLNRERLLSFKDFKIISFLLDEWRYDNNNSKSKSLKLIFFIIKYSLLILSIFILWKLIKLAQSSIK